MTPDTVPEMSGSEPLELHLRVDDLETLHALSQCEGDEELQRFALAALKFGSRILREASGAIDRDTIRKEGGEILYGGRTIDRPGYFVEPTIVKMPSQTEIVKQETFAPILYLLEYEDLEEAIALHNGVPQGLSSAIFTDSLRKVELFLSAAGSDCGIANVNIGTSGADRST